MFSILDYLMLVTTGLLGVAGAVSVLRNARRKIDLPLLFLTFLFLYLGAGGCVTLFLADESSLSELVSIYDVEEMDLARACGTVFAFSLPIWALGCAFRKHVVLSADEIRGFATRCGKRWHFEALMIFCAIPQAYVVATGHLGFEGVILDTSAGAVAAAPPLALLAAWMSVTLAPSGVFVMAARRSASAFMIVGFLWNVALVALVSRRSFLSVAFLSVLAVLCFRFSTRARMGFVVAGVAGASVVMVLFFSFRLSMWRSTLQRSEILNIVTGGFELLRNAETFGETKEKMFANATTRTFNVAYISIVAKNARLASGANGTILLYSVMNVVPGFILPQKHLFTVIGGEEAIAGKILRIETVGDQNNSVITAALTDFGYIGLSLYAVTVFGIIFVSLWIIRRTHGSEFGLAGLFYLMFALTYAESAFAGVFITLRLVVVLCIMGIVANVLIALLREIVIGRLKERVAQR